MTKSFATLLAERLKVKIGVGAEEDLQRQPRDGAFLTFVRSIAIRQSDGTTRSKSRSSQWRPLPLECGCKIGCKGN
jgi:hypothetical protein